MTRKQPWINQRCCDWDTFLAGLMAAAHRRQFPLLLLNWCEARRAWRRYGCTGGEVIQMQRARELNSCDFMYIGNARGGPTQGGDDGVPVTYA